MVLPDLAGQPPWVVVTVFALFVAGTLGVAWMRRGRPDPNSEDPEVADSATVPVEAGAHDAVQVIGRALDHLADVARREAIESESERAEQRDLRRQLSECEDEVQRLRQNGGRS